MTDRILPQYEHDGRNLTVAEWATVTGIRSYDISMRLRQGWTLARIIEAVTPSSAPAKLPKRKPLPKVASEIEVSPDARPYVPRLFKVRHQSSDTPQPGNVERFTHEGETLTLREWSVKVGVTPGTIGSRLRKGWTVEAALAPKRTPAEHLERIRPEPKLYTFDGRSLTIREWSEETDFSPSLILKRLAVGWPLERVLTERPGTAQRQRSNHITYNGMTMCEGAWAQHLGISRSALKNRLNNGWPLAQVLSPHLLKQRHALYAHDGKTLTLKQWAAETGLKYHTIMQRFSKGWTMARILTTPVNPNRVAGGQAAQRAGAAATQPLGAMEASEGGGVETFEVHRGPAGDSSRESAAKQAFS